MYSIISLQAAVQFLTVTFTCSTVCLILVSRMLLEIVELMEAGE